MGLSSTALTEVSAFTANVFPPQPGSSVSAADVQAGEQVMANRTTWLRDHGFLDQFTGGADSAIFTDVIYETFITNAYVSASQVFIDVPACLVNDVLICMLHTSASLVSGGSPSRLAFESRLAAKDNTGSTVAMTGARVTLSTTSAGLGILNTPISISGTHVVGIAGTCRIIAQGAVDTGNGITQGFFRESWQISVIRYRP